MTETKRFAFTKERLARLTVPTGKAEAWVFDSKSHWMGYRLTEGGVGAYYIFRRIKGKPAKVRLGGMEITIEQARKLADKVNEQIADGIDPREQLRKDRIKSATLGNLLEHFIDTHAKLHKKTWEADERMVERYLKDWKSRQLSAITSEHIRILHGRVGKEHGRYSANRLLSLLHAAYERPGDLWTGANPVHGIAKFKEQSRDRYLNADEIARFFKVLADLPKIVDPETGKAGVDEGKETIRDYLLILLLVGARRSNTAAMRWEQIDFGGATWRIPMTKAGQSLLVPLAQEAVQILLHRKATSESDWVFPTATPRKRSASGHIEQFKATWEEVLKRAKIADFRLHDLRRTLGSWMVNNGASLPLIGKVLGHKNVATTQVYARLSVDPARVGVNAATAAMRSLPAPDASKTSEGAK